MSDLTSIITAVTVFPDRARITRTARVPVAPGLQAFTLSDLPLALVTNSVRASGQGTARAKLLGVSTRFENFAETPATAARDLEHRIQDTEDSDAQLAMQVALADKEQKAIDGLVNQYEMFARGLALRERAPEAQGATYQYFSDRSRALQNEILRVGRERRDLAKELDRLRRELNTVRAARPRQRQVATIEVEVLTAGELALELTYVVMNAEWEPLYDIRLTRGEIELTYLAQVKQNTGEDWVNVALMLSTAQPALALVIPELAPWYVAPPPPMPMVAAPQAKGGPVMRHSAPMMPAAVRLSAPEQPAAEELTFQAMEVEAATVSESGAALTYNLPARADIPGNNDPRKVTVAIIPFKPDMDYVTAPKREAVCYRRATLKNDSPYTLLAGAAQLFENDDYLGATTLPTAAPQQLFKLALGADERVRVERKLVARDVDKAFLLGDRKRIRYAYTLAVENLRDTAQVIYLRDQLPIARDEQIKVRLDSAEPRPAEHTELNLLEWKLTLDKNTKQTVRFDFSVEFPKAMDVRGLP